MLKRFEVYGENTIMDFGEYGVSKETAKYIGGLLLKLTSPPDETREIEVNAIKRVRRI